MWYEDKSEKVNQSETAATVMRETENICGKPEGREGGSCTRV